jgi:hypothetical protein
MMKKRLGLRRDPSAPSSLLPSSSSPYSSIEEGDKDREQHK